MKSQTKFDWKVIAIGFLVLALLAVAWGSWNYYRLMETRSYLSRVDRITDDLGGELFYRNYTEEPIAARYHALHNAISDAKDAAGMEGIWFQFTEVD